MSGLTLECALAVASAAMECGAQRGFSPLCVAVLDAGAHDLVVKRSERAAFYRVEIARMKAAGCLGMGLDGRDLAQRAKAAPAFYAALSGVASRGLLPVPGGVLLRDAEGAIIGAIGVSGDTAENDEIAAIAGIEGAIGVHYAA